MKTFDIYFQDNENSNNKGFEISLQEAHDYITQHNSTNESYFQDYKNGVVQIVDNDTFEIVFEKEIL